MTVSFISAKQGPSPNLQKLPTYALVWREVLASFEKVSRLLPKIEALHGLSLPQIAHLMEAIRDRLVDVGEREISLLKRDGVVKVSSKIRGLRTQELHMFGRHVENILAILTDLSIERKEGPRIVELEQQLALASSNASRDLREDTPNHTTKRRAFDRQIFENVAYRPELLDQLERLMATTEEKSLADSGMLKSGKASAKRPLKIYYAFAERDGKFLDFLEGHLRQMEREGLIDGWAKRELTAGSDTSLILQQLEGANIIVFGLSRFFVADNALFALAERAMQRHKASEARVVPVRVRDFESVPSLFTGLILLPRAGPSVSSSRNRDRVFAEIARELRALVSELTDLHQPKLN